MSKPMPPNGRLGEWVRFLGSLSSIVVFVAGSILIPWVVSVERRLDGMERFQAQTEANRYTQADALADLRRQEIAHQKIRDDLADKLAAEIGKVEQRLASIEDLLRQAVSR